jgi:hypothetical protein
LWQIVRRTVCGDSDNSGGTGIRWQSSVAEVLDMVVVGGGAAMEINHGSNEMENVSVVSFSNDKIWDGL